ASALRPIPAGPGAARYHDAQARRLGSRPPACRDERWPGADRAAVRPSAGIRRAEGQRPRGRRLRDQAVRPDPAPAPGGGDHRPAGPRGAHPWSAMTATVLPVQRELAGLFRAALERAVDSGDLDLDPGAIPEPALERPRLAEHGDWATNVAMVLAKAAKAPPRKVAEAMVAHLELPDWVAGVEVAGPGFVNVRLDQRWFAGLVRQVLAAGESFGTIDLGHGEAVNVEFISANPTGPLHVGNARLAPMGDALANVLTATGHKVEREYYINDPGGQYDQLGASVEAAYLRQLGRA